MLLLQLFLGPLAFGDVGVSGDETGQLLIHEQRFALYQMREAAWASAFETVRLELECKISDAFDVFFRIAGAVFTAHRRDANQF